MTGAKPNIILYRADGNRITSYAKYDHNGMISKRVDIMGEPHFNKGNNPGYVSTPHVLEYPRNIGPDSTIRVHTPKPANVRKPRPDELQYSPPK